MLKKSSGAMLFATLAVVALAGAAQQGVLIRRQLKADSKEIYKIDTTSKQSVNTPQGGMDFDVTSQQTYTLTTTKVDSEKGVAEVDTELVTDKIDMGAAAEMMPPDQKVPVVKAHAKLDNRNRLIVGELPKMQPMAAMMGATNHALTTTMFVELPEKEVKVGDSWDIVLPKSPFTGDVENKLSAKLIGEKEVDGKKVWVVSVKGQIKTDTNTEKLGKLVDGAGLPDMTVKGTSILDAEGMVDETTGQTISITVNMKNTATVDAGMAIDIAGSSTLKMKLAR